MNRRRYEEKQTLNKIVDRAVERSRVPGTPTLGTSPTNPGPIISKGTDPYSTYPDENGNTVHVAMTEIDFTEDPQARTLPSPPSYDAPTTRIYPGTPDA